MSLPSSSLGVLSLTSSKLYSTFTSIPLTGLVISTTLVSQGTIAPLRKNDRSYLGVAYRMGKRVWTRFRLSNFPASCILLFYLFIKAGFVEFKLRSRLWEWFRTLTRCDHCGAIVKSVRLFLFYLLFAIVSLSLICMSSMSLSHAILFS